MLTLERVKMVAQDRMETLKLLALVLALGSPPRVVPAQGLDREKAGEIRWEPYRYVSSAGDTVAAQLGHLPVFENRADKHSRLIRLAFVRLPSTSKNPGPPLVYLDGGPGNSGISSSRGQRFKMMMALRDVGDVILMDHRGVGMSGPDMSCPDNFALRLDTPLDADEALTAARRVARACEQSVRARGVDLRGYTVKDAADDVDDLRRALGVTKINLLGLSYGTTHGLTVLRRHGGGINRAILAGVEGPDDAVKLPSRVDSTFARIDSVWMSDAATARELPSLLAAYRAARDTLRRHPVTVRVLPWREKDSVTITLGPLDLELVTWSMGGSDGLPWLPAILYRAVRGDFISIGTLAVSARRNSLNAMADRLDCATGASAERLNRVRRETAASMFGRAANLFFYPEMCDAWGSPDVGAVFRTPVHTTVPTLFISGTLDARTPPVQAELVRMTFAHSSHHIVTGAVHSTPLFMASPLTIPAMVHFLKTGEARDVHVDGAFRFLPATGPPLP